MRHLKALDVSFWGLSTAAGVVASGYAAYELYCVFHDHQGHTVSARAHKQIENHRSRAFIITVAASFVVGMLANHFWETQDSAGIVVDPRVARRRDAVLAVRPVDHQCGRSVR